MMRPYALATVTLITALATIQAARADDCTSFNTTYNVGLAQIAMREYFAYSKEGSWDEADTELKLADHYMDVGNADTVTQNCPNRSTLLDIYKVQLDILNAQMHGHDVVANAKDVEPRDVSLMHDYLAFFYHEGGAQRDPIWYGAMKECLKDYYAKIHHPYKSPEDKALQKSLDQ